uniref:Uncharacterized protein n=1 Tax=Paramormyrops kingsleyae TaxID=1676925 RepID=A0A3B3S5G6_9TELE
MHEEAGAWKRHGVRARLSVGGKGSGSSGLLISVYPFIRAWLNFHHILPSLGKPPPPTHPSGSHIPSTNRDLSEGGGGLDCGFIVAL